MKRFRRWIVAAAAAGAAIVAAGAFGDGAFTFYFWTDTHFDGADRAGLRADAVADMKRLEGEAFLAGFGRLDDVRFVLHGGDVTTNARPWMWNDDADGSGGSFLRTIRDLPWPVYEVRGNHDADGGRTCVAEAVRERHGNLWYSFDEGGVHFVGLDIVADPPGPGSEQLRWLKTDLESVGPNRPVILWWHIPPADADAWKPLAETLAPYNVVLILHGHTHRHRRYRWHGFDVWDGGHNDGRENAWSGDPSSFSVFRVEDGRLRACHYFNAQDRWETTWMLDKALVPAP